MINIRKEIPDKINKTKEAFFMTTLFLNGYDTYSTQQTTPKWMREERCGYCEPSSSQTQTVKSLWNKLVKHFK